MTDSPSDPRQPGDQRLARPPSDRYRPPEPPRDEGASAAPAAGRSGSPARRVALGAVAALAGASVTVILGGVLAVSAGLLVVAVTTGYAVSLAVTSGDDDGPVRAGAARAGSWPWIAAGLAVTGVAVGQLGLWLFARTEGGVLALPDYLGQTFGLLVPLEGLVAGVVAWWRTR